MTQDTGSSGRPPVDPASASAAPPPPQGAYPVYVSAPPQKKSGMLTRILMGVFVSLFIFSLLSNFYLTQIVSALMSGPHEETYQAGDDAEQRIVIVPVTGAITDETAVFVRRAFNVIRQNKESLPKAIVMRVDSPGGYVGSSDRIYYEVTRFKKEFPKIPVIVSMGSVAASGGYYVSAPADHIIAEPTCITGSIGVILQAATVEELLKKVGVEPVVIVADSSPKKDIANNIFRSWNEEDYARMKTVLNAAHERFMKVVSEGRSAALKQRDVNLSDEEVKAVSTGEIYTAAQAVANKLIDAEGYLDDAIAEAAKRSGMKGKPRVTIIQPPRGFNILNLVMKSEQQALPQNGKELATWLREATEPTLEYRWIPGR